MEKVFVTFHRVGKVFITQIFEKELYDLFIYIYISLQLNNKMIKQPFTNRRKSNRPFTKEDTEMANKRMKNIQHH